MASRTYVKDVDFRDSSIARHDAGLSNSWIQSIAKTKV